MSFCAARGILDFPRIDPAFIQFTFVRGFLDEHAKLGSKERSLFFFVFDDSDYGPHDRKYGFVVFNTETMSAEGYGIVPGANAYLPQGEVVSVLRDQNLEVLDLDTGRLSDIAGIGSGVEVLLPGR